MKRKSIALLLSLIMCVALLSACGANDTPDTGEPTAPVSTSTPTGQEPTDENKEQPTQEPEQEEPKEEEPEEPEKSAEPTQEEPKEEDNAGTAFLKLLQEEYKNGFVEGERPGCTYYAAPSEDFFAFISNGVVYIWDMSDAFDAKIYSYDIAAKKLSENKFEREGGSSLSPIFMMNGDVYCDIWLTTVSVFDCNGVLQKTATGGCVGHFDKGILAFDSASRAMCLYSYDLEKIAEIPTTVQREAVHGTTENVDLDVTNIHVAGGTVYVPTNEGSNKEWYRLNTDTYEWEKCESQPYSGFSLYNFCGKYGAREDGIYDWVTGEQVFAYGELYAPVCAADKGDSRNCYFGGDKYLGSNRSEYRWINLTDLSMSDPLPFPKKEAGDYAFEMYILNDTYCVYKDKYGWFLWNYNTGEEETIVMFEQ